MECLSWVRRCATGALLACSLASATCAGTILSPVAVTEFDLGTNDPGQPPEAMINQSGIDKPFTSGVTDFDAYLTTGDDPFAQAGPGEWWSSVDFSLPVEGHLDFDLGAVYTIDRMAIWNRTLENIEVYTSETEGGPLTFAGEFTLDNQANFFFSYLPDVIEFDTAHQARYLRIEVGSAYPFATFDTFAYAIVGEVAVDVTATTPGPAADFDNNGDVDGADLTEWRGAFGATAVGDADNDGDSDGDDFLVWQREVGLTSSESSVSAVPEPSSASLLGIAAALAVMRHGVHRRRA